MKNLTKGEILDNLLRDYYANPEFGDAGEKEEAILNALQAVNGFEQGSLDYMGYKINGNFNMDVEDAIDFIKDELNLADQPKQSNSQSRGGQR